MTEKWIEAKWDEIMNDVKEIEAEYVEIWKSGEEPVNKLMAWKDKLYAFNAKAMIDAISGKNKNKLLGEIYDTIKTHAKIIKTNPNYLNSPHNLIILMKSCYLYYLLNEDLPKEK
jgi:hypothetical protein